MLLYVHMVLVHCLEFCDFFGGVGGYSYSCTLDHVQCCKPVIFS